VPHAASALRGGDPALDADAVARLGLEPGRFILAPGTLEPRKNHRRLVRAFEMLAARDRGMRLVIVGAPGWGYRPILKAIEQSPVRDRILLTGFVDDELLASLLRTCALVAYVSLYEGFGLPVTEAMSAGAPVVTSSVSSLPEVAGDAAVLVDPDDPVAIHRGLVTWADAARETLAVYQQVLRAREGGEP
jgi:glycosyltransferase involved in cell wall biosynthesis